MSASRASHRPEPTPGSQEEPQERPKDALELSPIWQRSLVVAAGPFANFLLAVVLFAFVSMVWGKHVDALRVDTIAPGSAVAVAGLKPADVVAAIDGTRVENRAQAETLIGVNAGRPLALYVERSGAGIEPALGPWSTAQTLESLGVLNTTTVRNGRLQRFDPGTAIAWAVRDASVMSVIFVRETAIALWRLIPGMGSSDLGGPLALVQSSSKAAAAGLSSLLMFAAVFSIAVGAFNMLPIPPLDGGRLVLYGLEAVFSRTPGQGPQIARIAANVLMIVGVVVVLYVFVTLIAGDVLAVARKVWS